MEEEYDLVEEFDGIVNGLKRKALKAMWVGYLIGIVTGSGLTYALFHK